MRSLIWKTFGGLSKAYYMRQFFFAMMFPIIIFMALYQTMQVMPPETLIFLAGFAAINTFLYPYARFVYESIIGFILGDNMFIINGIVMLVAKLMTMTICWAAAIMIAPLGLVYLYFYHSRQEK